MLFKVMGTLCLMLQCSRGTSREWPSLRTSMFFTRLDQNEDPGRMTMLFSCLCYIYVKSDHTTVEKKDKAPEGLGAAAVNLLGVPKT
ncbi:hypothetical protein F5X96DRAFT_642827 [Biscogniauxia mediterranea]|nr:hypothetical protein F5X96DRAFT_642827 [Biscogniauxia mediterranea]